jgi:small nuclear ribonucleoprotein (snRNP)-like protein/predicted GNAT superfamily acetyltransferase
MKKLISICILGICLTVNAQTQCVSLAGYNNAYLNTISNDDVTYPPGYAFVTSGDIRYLKHDANDLYQFIQGDSLLYIGDLDIDISTASCANRTLTFSVVYLEGMAVDGDTIFTSMAAPTSYTGSGFTMTRVGNDYTITGNFDMVSLYSSTNFIFDVCLECNTGNCVSLDAYNNAYLNTISNDDVTYPPGYAFVTSGDIRYLKHDANDLYQFIQGDSLLYIGDLDIDISTASCANRTLTFSVVYLEGMAVDGDTIFTSMAAPTSYTGSGFTMTRVGNDYTITGNFDMVSLYSSTNFIFDVCLECNTGNCVSLDAYNNAYLNTISNDDVTYPPGYAFVTSGDIRYLKHDANDLYQFIQGDSLLYIGDLDIDISTASCANRTLTFSVVYLEGMAVDGDTIFTSMAAPTSYTGSGFTMTRVGNDYTITGNFDVVSLYSSTNFIFDVCLECNGVAGMEENQAEKNPILVYPNPTTDILFINTGERYRGENYYIYDYSGRLVQTGIISTKTWSISTALFTPGMYFLRLADGQTMKLIKN